MPPSEVEGQSIRILIADDHRLFRQGLRQICEVKGEFAVVGEAENGEQAVELAQRLQPDVILMDIRMPVLDGVQATRLITTENPNLPVIVLTMYREDHFVFDAIRAGASGYLLKDVDADEVLDAVRVANRGDALIDSHVAMRVLDEFRRLNSPDSALQEKMEWLTEGEMAVLRLVAHGEDNRAIALELDLAESTVANRLRAIYQKLHVNNRTQAALYALRHGWASLDEEQST
jgi:DNA-binding NarL/FixJ family response regulator